MISAWDCFHFATLELVRSSPIKQRLVCAYRRHLSSVPEDQVPNDIRETFEQVMSILRGVQPLRGEDAVAASVRKMSNQQADDCAALIVEIFGSMCKTHVNATRSGTVVQLHSVECASDDFDVPALTASN
jgi:hypothetical protein